MPECPSCALEIEEDTRDLDRCPYCGYEFPQQRVGFKLVALLLLLLMAFFGFVLAA